MESGDVQSGNPLLSANAGIINYEDTLIFDFSKAGCNSSFVDIPVYFHSDDEIYAIDFAVKINPARISFHAVITREPGFIVSAYYQSGDSTLRFTSFSFQPLHCSDSLLALRFTSSDYPVSSDFDTIVPYLNGDCCSKEVIPLAAGAGITAAGPVSFPEGDSVMLTASGAGNRYRWSTGDTTQAIVVSTSGLFTVSVATSGGCISSASISIVVSAPLPVELLSFHAAQRDDGILLSWKTASEINNDHFMLERSADHISWVALREIPGAGTSSMSHSYQVLDDRPIEGMNYYRLKQTDFDGRFSYSSVIRCKYTKEGRIVVLPNPASEKIQLRVSGDATVEIRKSNGDFLIRKNTGNGESMEINVSCWPNGIYLINVQNEFMTETKRISVVH